MNGAFQPGALGMMNAYSGNQPAAQAGPSPGPPQGGQGGQMARMEQPPLFDMLMGYYNRMKASSKAADDEAGRLKGLQDASVPAGLPQSEIDARAAQQQKLMHIDDVMRQQQGGGQQLMPQQPQGGMGGMLPPGGGGMDELKRIDAEGRNGSLPDAMQKQYDQLRMQHMQQQQQQGAPQ